MKWVKACKWTALVSGIFSIAFVVFSIKFSFVGWSGRVGISISRSGLLLCQLPLENETFWQLGTPVGSFHYFPPIESFNELSSFPSASAIQVTHYMTNLIAWSLFFILWRKSRKHPKGHCQACG